MSSLPAMIFLGLISGMLVNYLSDILPIKRRIARPVCTNCGEPQALRNYIFWPRRCPKCGKRRGLRVWGVEAAYTALIPWLASADASSALVPFAAGVPVWIFFGVVVVIDIEHRLVLHPVSLAGALIGLPLGIYLHGFTGTLLGGLAGYGTLYGLYWLGTIFTRMTRRLQGDEEEVALGFGDVNLAGVLGLLLGWPAVLIGLMISILIAGIFSLFLVLTTIVLRRYRAFMAIPYGPFLVAGAALMLFFPETAQKIAASISPLFYLGP